MVKTDFQMMTLKKLSWCDDIFSVDAKILLLVNPV